MASDQLDELMGVLGRMRDAADRLASSSGDDDAFREAATDASLLFLELKATNRAALEGVEATRATTAKAKLDLDHKRLELQNVLYEKGHIQKEIRACQDFRSAYDDETIGLCSVAEFKRRAPGEWKEAGDDPHAVMLKRLSHELAERKKLCELEKELEARKRTLQDGIKSRRKFLDGLGNQLKGLKRSTAPLQEHLALPITVEEKRKGAARLLPPPLYVTYTQLAAAREAFDDDFEVHIEGSVADAEALQRKAAAAEEEEARRREEGAAAETVAEAEYKAAGTFAGDEEETRKSKRARVSENERAVDESDPYAAHPLRVELRLGGASFTFTYLHNLHVVTANVKPREGGASANKGNRRGKGGGDETVDDDLLVNLFPGDTGADTPNIANKLRVAGFEYDRSRRDRPYRWAQHLAGLDFLAPVPVGRAPGADAETGVAKHQQQARVRNVLAALRARMASRSALKSQLRALARCDIDSLAVAKRLEMHPKSQLRSWREITPQAGGTVATGDDGPAGDDAGENDRYREETDAGTVADRLAGHDVQAPNTVASDWRDHGVRTYRAVVRAARQSGSAKHRTAPVDVVAEVSVSPEYPQRPPTFALSLERRVPPKPLPASDLDSKDDAVAASKDEDATPGDASNDLRLIEEEVNVRTTALLPTGGEDDVLGYCVVRLLQAVDACAECERWGGASDEAVGVRQMRRGRERRKELPPLL